MEGRRGGRGRDVLYCPPPRAYAMRRSSKGQLARSLAMVSTVVGGARGAAEVMVDLREERGDGRG
jgi:hypothetical protein